jgi:hypothetical protein
MITPDQMSQMRTAFEAARLSDADRRRSQRIHQQVHAEIAPWLDNRAGPSFGVIVEDFSTTGVGLRHTERFKVGAQYLLEIPRPGQRSLSAIFTVVRCDQGVGGWFTAELAPDELLEVALSAAARNKQSAPPQHRVLRNVLMLIALTAAATAVMFNLL